MNEIHHEEEWRALCYGSVCSGIEAVTVAWRPLGLRPAWLSEIDPFANAVLAHHYASVPNLGDMTRIAPRVLKGEIEAPDILVGGTPCQSFSIAGLRRGLCDPRGALTLKYVELANAIDEVRQTKAQAPAIVVWENVPGVLSDRANAFGCLLGAISGERRALRPAGSRWTHAGCVYGPQRTIAWRVLDAQYFGLAQRRKRVFLIASARTDFDPAAVLFESESVRRDTPPCRQAQEDPAATAAPGACGHRPPRSARSPEAAQETLSFCYGGGNTGGAIDFAACLTARGHRCDFEMETFAVTAPGDTVDRPLNCATSATEDDRNRGVPIVHRPLSAVPDIQCLTGAVTHALNGANDGKGGSEDGTGRGVPIISMSYKPGAAAAFAQNSRGELRFEGHDGQRTGALAAGGGTPGQGVPMVISVAFHGNGSGTPADLGSNLTHELHTTRSGRKEPHAPSTSLEAHFQCASVHDTTEQTTGAPNWEVRRLMPLECERLQGLPDDYTRVPYRGKVAADGPRYKAIGNSMAVPCVAWIGRRVVAALKGRQTP